GFMEQAAKWAKKNLTLTTDDSSIKLDDKLTSLITHSKITSTNTNFGIFQSPTPPSLIILKQLGVLNPWNSLPQNRPIVIFDLDAEKIARLLKEEVAPTVEQSSQDAKLTIVNGRATEFRPDIIGQEIDYAKTLRNIRESLFKNISSAPVVIVQAKPDIILGETNDLGIKELVARGESDFAGSSNSRIQNIKSGASKFHGLILAPGQEFSFNQSLGPVTAATGFKPEMVIKTSGTVLEVGGGLCQVSTTAFRAALYGGLPITARKNHSYAVKYYSPQGTDATIYPGAADFKFLNDTPASLLITSRVEGTKLIFEYYGTNDGRQVAIDGPYQYDKKPDGSMKARLARTISYGQKQNTETFYSKYVSKDLFPTSYEYPKPLSNANPPNTANNQAIPNPSPPPTNGNPTPTN
ncbi:MAG: VanW family protein, partial [bacterium]|nr:VanW family protein [bacterium]